jgi:RNA polymerase sigma-70 factor (ECF subfamily)
VFQNTFLQLHKKSGQYQPGSPVRPWLYTIATNQAIDALRRAGRHQAVSLDEFRETTGEGESQRLMELLEARDPGPLDRVHGIEQRDRVRAAVDRLPDFMKQVLVMAYYQGLKYRDIADALAIPVGTVKSRLHAALVRLHETLSAAPTLDET